MEAQTPDGEPFEVLAILDGYTRECLSLSVEHQISLENVIDRLFELLVLRDVPKYVVLGSGSESVSRAVGQWLSHLPVETAVAEPNDACEEDAAWLIGTRVREEVLSSQDFATLSEVRVLLENWRRRYNETRPQHSPLEDEPQAALDQIGANPAEAGAASGQTLKPEAVPAAPAKPEENLPAGVQRQEKRQTKLPKWAVVTTRVAEYVGIVLVVVLMTMVVLALLAPHFGWRADTVLSGSMEPALPVGSVQVTRPVAPERIQVGDIITFRSPTNGKLMSHRVAAVEAGESYQFRTKGDANEDVDPYLIPAENVVGRVCFKVAHVGRVVEYLKTPIGFVLLGLIGIALVVAEMSTMVEVRWKETARADGVAK
ncbi:MAG: signal peptidase I [Dehalococcoidia bacterium]|nr:signal peptidase I [Dehalococcoidia bacterium]